MPTVCISTAKAASRPSESGLLVLFFWLRNNSRSIDSTPFSIFPIFMLVHHRPLCCHPACYISFSVCIASPSTRFTSSAEPPPRQLHFGPFIPVCIKGGGEGQASLIRGYPCLITSLIHPLTYHNVHFPGTDLWNTTTPYHTVIAMDPLSWLNL